jgi:hypothetical protein
MYTRVFPDPVTPRRRKVPPVPRAALSSGVQDGLLGGGEGRHDGFGAG